MFRSFNTVWWCLLFLELVIGGRVKRVIGGLEVKCGTQERVASLRNCSSSQHLCGATIVSPRYALTAAHCVYDTPDTYYLSLNNYCINNDEVPPTAAVLEIITHQSYNKYTRSHDIALLRINLELENATWLSDDLLPKSSFGISGNFVYQRPSNEQLGECDIYGYGIKDMFNMNISDKLLAANLKIMSLDECTQLLGVYVAPAPDGGMMCAIGNGVDACQGDSGGPLICGNFLEGISSYGQSCGVPGLPGVYTNVGAHLRWIRGILNASTGLDV